MKARDKWLLIAADIIAYEMAHSDDGELLSEVCDRLIERFPIIARLGIAGLGLVLTAHLANLIPNPDRFDPISVGFWRRFSN